MNDNYSASITKNSLEDYFDISDKDKKRIELISEQEALRETEKVLRRKIESGPDSDSKFGEHRKVIKLLFDKMFENQSLLLRIAQW